MDNSDIINTEQFRKVREFFKRKGHFYAYIDKGDKVEFMRNEGLIMTLKKEDIMKLEIPDTY